jgi:hypothetical protein
MIQYTRFTVKQWTTREDAVIQGEFEFPKYFK